jgi:hypothetical protein
LTQWKGSMIRCSSMTTSVRRKAAPVRRKGGDDTS